MSVSFRLSDANRTARAGPPLPYLRVVNAALKSARGPAFCP